MRVKVHVLAVLLVVAIFASVPAFGAGFGLYEYSARGNALGGAMIGRADDPSALAYNPAGITRTEGESFMFGATFIMPTMDVVNGFGSYSSVDNTWIPPHFYYTKQLSDRLWWGVATYSRFGLGTEFPADWPGRFNNYEAVIQSVSVNPNVAWKVNDKLSLAVGVEVMWFDFEQKRKIGENPAEPLEDFSGLKISGDDIGWGWNVAAHYRPNDRWSLGLSYHGEVDQTVEGSATFSPEIPTMLENGPARGDVTLPQSVGAGVCYRPNEWVSYEVDAVWTGWSSYDNLTIHFDNPPYVAGSDKAWEDVWRYQFGVEFQMRGGWQLRLGYVYDNSPVPDATADYMVPANDRQIYSIGAGWTRGSWSYDLSYCYLDIKDRTIAGNPAEGVFPSDYENGDSDLIAFSVSYRL